MKNMKGMTLNLTAEQMAIVGRMAMAKGLSKTELIRKALRLYQTLDQHMTQGAALKFVNRDGSEAPVVFIGAGWPGMD